MYITPCRITRNYLQGESPSHDNLWERSTIYSTLLVKEFHIKQCGRCDLIIVENASEGEMTVLKTEMGEKWADCLEVPRSFSNKNSLGQIIY